MIPSRLTGAPRDGRTGDRPGPVRPAPRHVAAGVLALAALAGCAAPPPPSAPSPPPSSGPRPADPMILAFDRDLTGGVRQALVERWNTLHPGHPARIVALPDGTDLARSQVVGALQSGTGGYDVVNMDVTWTAEFAEQGLIRPWPERLGKDFPDSVKETVEYEGKTWGVPFNTDAALLYYRKDILKRKKIPLPANQKQFDNAADRAEDATGIAGYISQFKEYEGLTVNVMEAVWDNDGDLPARSEDDLSAVREGIHDLQDRLQFRMHEDSGTADESVSLNAFSDGEVVFMRNWPFAYERLATTMDRFEQRVGVTELPWASALGGQNLAVTAGADDPAWARKLVGFLTSKESERCLLERGFAATRGSAYAGRPAERCDLPAPAPPSPEAGGDGGDEASGGDRAAYGALPPSEYGMLLRSIKAARPRPVTPYYAAFTRKIQSVVHQGLEGSADRAADVLADELGPILDGR